MINKESKAIFKNREEASERLISEIPLDIRTLDNVIVLAVSEGGVFFADRVAKKLECRFDILLTEPIYSTINKELIIAMVGETEEIVMHKALTDAFDISKDYIYGEAYRCYQEKILLNIEKYRKGIPLQDLKDKYVILIDECVETGLTMMTAVKTSLSLGAKNIFIAVPILDNVVYEKLVTTCDNIFCPLKINDYISIDYYYEDIEPFSFEEIELIMKKNKIDEGIDVE